MTETREQVLELAANFAKDVHYEIGAEAMAMRATIARALRLLAETMGREAEPVQWRVTSRRDGRHQFDTRNAEDAAWASRTLVYAVEPLYASPPPVPDYAAGRRDGLEEAAIEWRNARTVVCRKGALASQEEWARLGTAETALSHEVAIGPAAHRRAKKEGG